MFKVTLGSPGGRNHAPLLSTKGGVIVLILFSLLYSLMLFLVSSIIGLSWISLKGREDQNDDLRFKQESSAPPNGIADRNVNSDYISCQTSKGDIKIELDPASSPNGVMELRKMVNEGFMIDVPFFRVNEDITQFGVREKKFKYQSNWVRDENHPDKSQRKPWKRGTMAMIGGTQMVIVKKNSRIMGLANHDTVVGRIDESGMKVIDQLYAYNDIIDHPSRGPGPDQTKVYQHGWTYLTEEFPLVDRIIACEVGSG